MLRLLMIEVTAIALAACAAGGASGSDVHLADFARRYAAAWSSHDATSVASFYAEQASLTINGGRPATGRQAVAAAAQGFIDAYPDLVVTFDRLERRDERVLFHWTFAGTNSGPGGTGRTVRISGYEDWQLDRNGLIAESLGHYDAADWDRQVHGR